jgi:ribosomal protein L15
MLVGFANSGQLRELESPSVKLAENSSQPVTMKRNEVIDEKIKFIETNLEKLKELKVTTDTKDILQTSLALYKYILPVYKMEYEQLAKLYDEGASNEKIQLLAQTINDKYYSHFNELYSKLISSGKLYAERNSIKVNW